MCSGLDDWIDWHFFTITVDYNSSHTELLLNDVWRILYEESLTNLSLPELSLSLTLRLTVSRPVCLGIKHPSGTYGQIFITVRQLRVFMWGALWREDGSVVYDCCWPSPAQSFSGWSPVGLATIFYCLRFETSLFVTSYDSQSYSIPPPHGIFLELSLSLILRPTVVCVCRRNWCQLNITTDACNIWAVEITNYHRNTQTK
jgi:hypothetical protein